VLCACLLSGTLAATAPDPSPGHGAGGSLDVAPAVSLEVTSPELGGLPSLRDSELLEVLTMRLLEDGYRVHPAHGDEADVEVLIRSTPQGAWLEAHGRVVETAFVPVGTPAVVSLELQQWMTALVDQVQPSERRATATGITVELQGTPGLAVSKVYAGLLARGVPVTLVPREDDLRLCVQTRANAWVTWIELAKHRCQTPPEGAATTVVSAAPERDRERMLDTVAALRDEARSASADSVATPAPAKAPSAEEPPVETHPVEPHTTAKLRGKPVVFTILAQGGFVVRSTTVDGAYGARVRVGQRRALGGGLEVELIPSEATELRVLETTAQGFLDWRFALRRRGMLSVAAAGGLYVNRYTQTAPLGRRGQQLGGAVTTRSSFGFSSPRGALLELSASVGMRGPGPSHLYDGRSSWSRSALFVGLAVSVGWDVRLTGGRPR